MKAIGWSFCDSVKHELHICSPAYVLISLYEGVPRAVVFLNSSWGKDQPTQPEWHSVRLYETSFMKLLVGGTLVDDPWLCCSNVLPVERSSNVCHCSQMEASRNMHYTDCFVSIYFQMRVERGRPLLNRGT